MKFTYILVILLAIVVAGGYVYLSRPQEDANISLPTPEATSIDNTMPLTAPQLGSDIQPITEAVRVTLQTSMGDIAIILDGSLAPFTVGNFVSLARKDFYDGVTFHRVIEDFMIQGGDPLSRDLDNRGVHGTGGPGYKFGDEINERKLVRGVLAMANAGPDTNGSQFFIITADALPNLDGKHTAFGVVEDEESMRVVDAISKVDADEGDNPLEPVVIQDVVVRDGGLPDGLEEVE